VDRIEKLKLLIDALTENEVDFVLSVVKFIMDYEEI